MLSFPFCFSFGYFLFAAIFALPTDHTFLAGLPNSYTPPHSVGTSPVNDFIASNSEPPINSSPIAVSQSSHIKIRRREATSKQSHLNERALSLQLPPQPPIALTAPAETNPPPTNTTASSPPICWPSLPIPRSRLPISHPHDCHSAMLQLLEGGAMAPAYWTSWHTWTSGSCSIRLIPAVISSGDRFTRLDIARVAARIQTSCVNEAHGWKGGILGVGGRRMFDVSVEAAGNAPLGRVGDGLGGGGVSGA